MGQRLIVLASRDDRLHVVAAIDAADSASIGKDAGMLAGIGDLGLPLSTELVDDVDVVIDFSVPAAAVEICQQCAKRGIPLVLATTGLEEQQQSQVIAAAEQIAICQSPNMSLAVNLVMNLAKTTGRALQGHSGGVDVEILERHHRYKEDAPSGTALAFGKMISEAMGKTRATHGRHGRPGARPPEEIGYHAIRTGDNPGEHTVVFGMSGETIELRVAASNRDCYAHGALVAAEWLVGKSPGIYTMSDVLSLSDGKV